MSLNYFRIAPSETGGRQRMCAGSCTIFRGDDLRRIPRLFASSSILGRGGVPALADDGAGCACADKTIPMNNATEIQLRTLRPPEAN